MRRSTGLSKWFTRYDNSPVYHHKNGQKGHYRYSAINSQNGTVYQEVTARNGQINSKRPFFGKIDL